jgi:ketosteroid isomerase-like protein
MANKNVELIRRSSVLVNEGHWDAAITLLAPDVEWVIAKEHPEARVLVGRQAVVEYQREWEAAMPKMRFEFDRVLECDNRVVAMGAVRGTGGGSGADVRVPLAIVYEFRDGLIARAEEYLNPADALEAVGLAE